MMWESKNSIRLKSQILSSPLENLDDYDDVDISEAGKSIRM